MANETQDDGMQLFPKKTPEKMAENKGNADDSNATELAYDYSVEQAQQYFLKHGLDVAHRTISNYCQTSKFKCKKFLDNAQHVRRWRIALSSLEHHRKELQKDMQATVSNSSSSKNDFKIDTRNELQIPSKQSLATDNKYTETIEVSKIYMTQLEKDNIELTQTVADLRKGIGALNDAVKLSMAIGGLLNQATKKSEPPPSTSAGEKNRAGEGDSTPTAPL